MTIDYDYTINELHNMLEHELSAPESQRFGATLQHWQDMMPISIDSGALEVLIAYYCKKQYTEQLEPRLKALQTRNEYLHKQCSPHPFAIDSCKF